MKENNINDIYSRLQSIFSSRVYRSNLNNPKSNWLDIEVDEAINSVLKYIDELSSEIITVL